MQKNENPSRSLGDFLAEFSGKMKKGSWPQVLIGTLNIFTSPAKTITAPIAGYLESGGTGKKTGHSIVTRLLPFIFFSVFLIFVVSLILYETGQGSGIGVKLAANPEEPKNGEPMRISVTVSNRTRGDLQDAALAVRLPAAWSVIAAPWTGGRSGVAVIGEIPKGKNRIIVFDVVPYAALSGGEEKVIATVTAASAAGARVGLADSSFALRESMVSLEIRSPEYVAAAARAKVALEVANNGSVKLGSFLVALCGSGAVSLSGGACEEQTFPSLAPHEKTVVEFNFAASSSPATSVLAARVILKQDGGDALLAEGKKTIKVVDPGLSVKISAPVQDAKSKDAISIPISLARSSQRFVLSGLKIIGRSAAAEIDLCEASAEEAAKLQSGGATVIKCALRNGETLPETIRGRAVIIDPESGITLNIESVETKLSLLPEIVFSATSRYFTDDGEALGRGPEPPTIGEKTEYWIFWSASNLPVSARSLEISAPLTRGAEFTGRWTGDAVLSGAVTYNAKSRRVSWSPASELTALPRDLNIAFAVAIRPGFSDLGKSSALLGESRLRLTTESGMKLETTSPALASSLVVNE